MTTVAATQAPDEARGGFRALMRHRNYALIWSGQLISQIGDRFTWVAISLWVYAETGSALSVSYAILALLLAPAFVGFVAGALVDRLDRRRILMTADLVRAGLVALIPWLMAQGLIWVYIDLFLISAASAFFRPAMFAVIPQSVPKKQLLQANAYFASMDTSTEIFGPALAGLLAAWLGYAAVLWIDASTYVFSGVLVSALRLTSHPTRGVDARDQLPSMRGVSLTRQVPGMAMGDREGIGVRAIARSIREGLRYVRSDPVQVALLAALAGGFWVAGLNSLQTPLAKGTLGVTDVEFGWFQSIWGVGFVAASLLLGWYGTRLPRGQTVVAGYLLWALAVGAMGLAANYGMLVIAGFWVGFANMLVFVNVSTIMMEHTPADKLGRVITTRQVALALMRATALLGFGWLADQTTVRGAILAMAGISVAGTLLARLRFPALWRYGLEEAPVPRRVAPAPAGVMADLDGRLVEPALSFTLGRLLRADIDPEFDEAEQRWLNAAVMIIVGAGWLALAATAPLQTAAMTGAVVVALGVAHLIRRAGGRVGVSE